MYVVIHPLNPENLLNNRNWHEQPIWNMVYYKWKIMTISAVKATNTQEFFSDLKRQLCIGKKFQMFCREKKRGGWQQGVN